MRYSYVFLLIASLGFASCKTLKKATSVTQHIDVNINQYPTMVDLSVSPQKVEKTIIWDYSLFQIGQPSFEDRKGNLIADIVKENAADVLLEEQSIYTKIPFGKRTLTITGYPAKYKNFRKADKEDLQALEIMNSRVFSKKTTVIKKYNSEKKGLMKKIFSR